MENKLKVVCMFLFYFKRISVQYFKGSVSASFNKLV